MNREDFPFLKKDIIYFDNSATSLKPQAVINKIVDYYENYSVNIGRGSYDLSYDVEEEITETRCLIKKLINAASENEIIFTSGSTESLRLVIDGFLKRHLNKGDEILTTYAEHSSLLLPLKQLGCVIKYVKLNEFFELTLENIKKESNQKTKAIIISHITNTLGDTRPINEIGAFAKENNIITVIDGAQSISRTEVDVTNIDFFVSSGHKMLGPTGIGFLYGKEKHLKLMNDIKIGGGSVISYDDNIILKKLPHSLESGTLNISGILGLKEAIKYLNNLKIKKIKEYESSLGSYLFNKLTEIKHIEMINKKGNTSVITFNVEGIFSEDVAFYLNKYNVYVRTGDHCAKLLKNETNKNSSIRVSLNFYNTKEEIDTLVNLLNDKDKILKEMI